MNTKYKDIILNNLDWIKLSSDIFLIENIKIKRITNKVSIRCYTNKVYEKILLLKLQSDLSNI